MSEPLKCKIIEDSLCFNEFDTLTDIITRNQIYSISINHHWSFDELKITTTDGLSHIIDIENGYIYVINDNRKYRYSLCKIDSIFLLN